MKRKGSKGKDVKEKQQKKGTKEKREIRYKVEGRA